MKPRTQQMGAWSCTTPAIATTCSNAKAQLSTNAPPGEAKPADSILSGRNTPRKSVIITDAASSLSSNRQLA
jgi:hypothetical protein